MSDSRKLVCAEVRPVNFSNLGDREDYSPQDGFDNHRESRATPEGIKEYYDAVLSRIISGNNFFLQ